jgi:hypothetical protein
LRLGYGKIFPVQQTVLPGGIMSTLSLTKRLIQELEGLSPALIEEILDFVLFIKARREEDAFLWQQVEETHTYRQQNPNEVVTVSAEEWDTLTADLNDEA